MLTWCVLSAGGAGGKGVWGRSGELYEPVKVDEKDPNFDEDQVTPVVLMLVIPRLKARWVWTKSHPNLGVLTGELCV